MFIESLCRNGLYFIHLPFSPFYDFTWLPPKSPFVTLLLEILDEVQRFSELLHSDDLHHLICWILLRADIYQMITLLSTTHWRVLWYLTSMCFIRFVIPVILSEMNHTLTVAMNPNWILYDTKCHNQSSQPQSFLWHLNCSHILLFSCKSNCILQLCFPTHDALSYCEHITRHKSSLIKISRIICINIAL